MSLKICRARWIHMKIHVQGRGIMQRKAIRWSQKHDFELKREVNRLLTPEVRKPSQTISLCTCRKMWLLLHDNLEDYMSWQVFWVIEMVKQWNWLVGETVVYPWYDSRKNSLGTHLSVMPWGILDVAIDRKAILDYVSVSCQLFFLYMTVKVKGRSEWRGRTKDFGRSISETLISNFLYQWWVH